MIFGKKIVVVMPAYNAEKTLRETYQEIPFDIVDYVILTDDASHDATKEVAKEIGINEILIHNTNKGYGANQKTCYNRALEVGGDIIIMLHPDHQYTPKLIHSMAYLIANNVYEVVLGSRILGSGALKGGMPLTKYIVNRLLTFIQNIALQKKLSEYHTGYRAFSRRVLLDIDYNSNSDGFVFDNEILAKILYKGYDIAEITCPTKYFENASSINYVDGIMYSFGVLKVSLFYALSKMRLFKSKLYK